MGKTGVEGSMLGVITMYDVNQYTEKDLSLN